METVKIKEDIEKRKAENVRLLKNLSEEHKKEYNGIKLEKILEYTENITTFDKQLAYLSVIKNEAEVVKDKNNFLELMKYQQKQIEQNYSICEEYDKNNDFVNLKKLLLQNQGVEENYRETKAFYNLVLLILRK